MTTPDAAAKPKPKPKPVTIVVNGNAVQLPDHKTTGEQIKLAAGVELEFTLYRKTGAELHEIGNTDELTVHDREEFVAVSGQDVS